MEKVMYYNNDFNVNDDMKTLPFITCEYDSIVLNKLGIHTTFQLLGVVLSFKKNSKVQTHTELYKDVCTYFKDIAECKQFVMCIFEKLDTVMPGFCDLDLIEDRQ